MPTADDLITECQGLLRSWNLNAEQMTTLGTPMTAASTTFTVTDTQGAVLGMSSGIVEIGDELIYVSNVSSSGDCSVPAWGRGHSKTTAAAHAAGDRVTSQPAFPRQKVLDAINETIGRIYPSLFAVKTANFKVTAPSITYDMPDDAISFLDARWKTPGAAAYWKGVRKARFNPSSGTTASTGSSAPYTNVTLDIRDPMVTGQDLLVTYTARPTKFTTSTDAFSVTGLPESCIDVLVGGAAQKLTVSQELSRLQLSSIEQQNRSQLVAPSAALTSSRFLEQQFQTRLKEEADSLRAQYPPRIVGVWV